MKRKFGFALLLTVLFTLLFAAGAQAACSHPIYKYVVGKKATCCEAGYKNLVCSKCGWVRKAKASTIPATCKHLRTRILVTKQPTCTATGVQKTYCASTGKVIKTVKLDKLGHSGKLVTVKKATCCASGYQNRVCTRCNATIATNVKALPATGKHARTRVLVTVQPTCTKTGTRKVYCASTNKLLRTEKIKATGHLWTKYAIHPGGCADISYEELVCKTCNAKMNKILSYPSDNAHISVKIDTNYVNPADGKTYIREYCEFCGRNISLTPLTVTKPGVTYPEENTHGNDELGSITMTKPTINYPATNTHGN